jgi:hypothetical protein
LALAQQVREVVAKVGVGEAPKVPLAPEPRPLGQYGERQYLGLRERNGPSGLRQGERAMLSPPVVDEHIERDEKVFEIHSVPPFVSRNVGWSKKR